VPQHLHVRFDYVKTPAMNTILHDAAHDSQLVLGLVPRGSAGTPHRACDTIVNQPSRTNTAPVPSRSFTIGGER
jgi:hypothetical protein